MFLRVRIYPKRRFHLPFGLFVDEQEGFLREISTGMDTLTVVTLFLIWMLILGLRVLVSVGFGGSLS